MSSPAPAASPLRPPGSPRLADAGAALVLALAALCAYANSFSGPFVFDDFGSIVDNPTIRNLWPPWSIFHPPMGSGETVGGRPLLNVTFAINYALGGTNVAGYHVGNFLIHLAAGLALLGVVRRTLRLPGIPKSWQDRSGLLALVAATLWTVHPLQTQSVTYVVQRAESLMGLFYLWTFYGFIRGVTEPHFRRWLGFSLGSCLMGMASKEVMVTAPILILFYDRAFVAGDFRTAWKRRKKYYLGLAATWGVLIAIVWSHGGSRGASAGLAAPIKWSDYLLTQAEALTTYLRLAVFPINQIFDYGEQLAPRLSEVTGDIAIIGSLLAATAYATWRWPKSGFLGVWFFAILAPSSLIPISTQPIDEHRVYLSLAAFLVGIVLAIQQLGTRCMLVITVCLALAFTVLTIRRNHLFARKLTLWNDTVKKRPQSWRAHDWLAGALPQTPENLPTIVAQYEIALKLAPDRVASHGNLANLLIKIPGQEERAFDHFETALRLDPAVAGSHINLANALLYHYGGLAPINPSRVPPSDRDRKWREPSSEHPGAPRWLSDAILNLKTALELDPSQAVAHNNLGNAYQRIAGSRPLAIHHYQEALRLDPAYPEAWINLGNAWLDAPGQTAAAISCFEKALILTPDSIDAHNGLASALRRIPGRLPQAIHHYQLALRLAPDLPLLHYNLAGAYAENGRSDEAIVELRTALRLSPDFPEASRALKALDGMKSPGPLLR